MDITTGNKSKKKARLGAFKDGRDRALWAVVIICNFLAGSCYPGFLFVFGRWVDAAAAGKSGDANAFLAIMIVIACFLFLFSSVGYFCAEVSAERQLLRMRRQLPESIMRQEMAYFDQFDATTLAAQFSYDSIEFRSGVGFTQSMLYVYIGLVLASFANALRTSWKTTLIYMIALPFIVAAGIWATYTEILVTKSTKEAYKDAASSAQETIGAIKTVKAFNLEYQRDKLFNVALDKAYHVGIMGGQKRGLGMGLHYFILFVSFGPGFWYAAHLIADSIRKHGDLCRIGADDTIYPREEVKQNCFSVGDAIIVFWCVTLASYFLSKSGYILSGLSKARAAVRSVCELFGRTSAIDQTATEGVRDVPFEADIEFRHVGFGYMTPAGPRKVFGDLNLKIPAGKSVALVGGSGCGKSTTVQLLERFYDIDSGELLIDGRPIKSYNLRWLRDQIALVSQEPRLFNDTIANNIAVGRPGATREEIIRAAKEANADEFVSKFPKGYDTCVGEGGGQLSGGQKQRIAIARAILRQPKLLILDEATSALDNESEKIVQETLNKIVEQGKRTTIIIAHRLTTVRRADIIVVLDVTPEGSRVVEQGTHAELLKIDSGLYSCLVASQLGKDGGVDDKGDQTNRASVLASIASQFAGEITGRQGSLVRLHSKFAEKGSSSQLSYDGRTGRGSRLFGSRLAAVPEEQRQHYYRRTLKVMRPHLLKQIWACAGGAVNGVLWPLVVVGFSQIVGMLVRPTPEGIMTGTRSRIWVFFALSVFAFIGLWIQTSMGEFGGQVLVRFFRKHTFGSIMRQDVSYFDEPQHSTGALMTLLSGESYLVKAWGGQLLALYFQCAAGVIFAVVASLVASWKLGLVALACFCVMVPLSYLQYRVQSKVLSHSSQAQEDTEDEKVSKQLERSLSKPVDEEEADPQNVINEIILNIRTVTAFNMQEAMQTKYVTKVMEEYKANKKRCFAGGLTWGLSQALVLLILVFNLWYAFKLIKRGEADASSIMQGVFTLMIAAMNIGKALSGTSGFARSREAAGRLYAVMDHKPFIDDLSTSGQHLTHPIERVEFNEAYFRYPTRLNYPVYAGVTFDIKAGQTVALVGASGTGKSTAVQLLLRFYDLLELSGTATAQNRLDINGVDIRNLNVQSLRRQIGLVGQEPVLFRGTIEENILNGDMNASPSDVEEAAKKANAYDFIKNLPEGFQTDVGQGGSKLSGGQKQRIAIARALLRKPKLLILDEATSALDAESERIVQNAFNKLFENKTHTTLVVAHRLSTIRNADKIVVFLNPNGEGSTIAEVGTHDELMKIRGGIYAGLVRIAQQ